jgi:hypothetical protein
MGGKEGKLGFFIANLGHDRIILGHPWFKQFNPTIDWPTNTLKGDEVVFETAGYQTKMVICTIPQPKEERPTIDHKIPKEYHQHWEVFDEGLASQFPPARNEDHAITLKPGTPATFDGGIY